MICVLADLDLSLRTAAVNIDKENCQVFDLTFLSINDKKVVASGQIREYNIFIDKR